MVRVNITFVIPEFDRRFHIPVWWFLNTFLKNCGLQMAKYSELMVKVLPVHISIM